MVRFLLSRTPILAVGLTQRPIRWLTETIQGGETESSWKNCSGVENACEHATLLEEVGAASNGEPVEGEMRRKSGIKIVCLNVFCFLLM